ncbi:MAG: hypothetical protein OJF47_002459 [Nitrospira sp.]|nr:MAG: hypothetical protein OJF47_002459 [Nitrospira sp.]
MSKTDLSEERRNILSGVGDIIDRYFGVTGIGKTLPHYRHKESCIKLSKPPSPEIDMLKVMEDVYKRIKTNWENAARPQEPRSNPGSQQNWRFSLNPVMAEGNDSLEVQLERGIARVCMSRPSERDRWANQVPTASGLVPPHNDKHRNIDLIHKRREGEYEFIELKVESNTPLYAAIEILLYGLLYVFRRQEKDSLVTIDESEGTKEQRALLNAALIHLRVLAPSEYYKGYDLAWLEDKIREGLRQLVGKRALSFRMDFEFQHFPTLTTADLKQGIDDVRIVEELQNRRSVYRRIG